MQVLQVKSVKTFSINISNTGDTFLLLERPIGIHLNYHKPLPGEENIIFDYPLWPQEDAMILLLNRLLKSIFPLTKRL